MMVANFTRHGGDGSEDKHYHPNNLPSTSFRFCSSGPIKTSGRDKFGKHALAGEVRPHRCQVDYQGQ